MLGVLLTLLWGVPMSYILKTDKEESQDPKLFSPFIRKFMNIPKEVELEELPLKQSHVERDSEIKIDIKQGKNLESQEE